MELKGTGAPRARTLFFLASNPFNGIERRR